MLLLVDYWKGEICWVLVLGSVDGCVVQRFSFLLQLLLPTVVRVEEIHSCFCLYLAWNYRLLALYCEGVGLKTLIIVLVLCCSLIAQIYVSSVQIKFHSIDLNFLGFLTLLGPLKVRSRRRWSLLHLFVLFKVLLLHWRLQPCIPWVFIVHKLLSNFCLLVAFKSGPVSLVPFRLVLRHDCPRVSFVLQFFFKKLRL